MAYKIIMTDFTEHTTYNRKSIFWFGLVFLVIGFSRYLPLDHPNLFNFSPVLAIFLISGAYLKNKISWALPIGAIICTDFLLNPNYGVNFLEPFMIITLFSYSLIFLLGKKMGNQSSMVRIFSASIASALIFHILTCSFSWLANPAYAKSFSGWFQALVFGEPGYAPSYLFLRNSILSTSLFAISLSLLARFLLNRQTLSPSSVCTEVSLKSN